MGEITGTQNHKPFLDSIGPFEKLLSISQLSGWHGKAEQHRM